MTAIASLIDPLLQSEQRHHQSVVIPTGFQHGYSADLFLRRAYQYWQRKGAVCIVVGQLVDLMISFFILCVVLVLCGAVDYDALGRRLQHMDCANGTRNSQSIFRTDCHGNRPVDIYALRHAGWVLWLASALCCACWLAALVHTIGSIPQLLEMRKFYRAVLKISDQTVQTTPWDTVMRRISRAQDHYMIAESGTELTELQIVNCITRTTNYTVGMYNDAVIDPKITISWLGASFIYLPLSLEYNLDYALTKVAYDQRRNMTIHTHNQEEKAQELRRWFRVLAAVNLLLAPGILVFRAAHFIFRYVDEWRRRPGALAARQWDPWARWKLREFCELDHVFDDRLRRAHKPAVAFVGMFNSELQSILARFVLVVCGGFVIVCLATAVVYDDGFLTVDLTLNRSVAFWISVASVAMAGASAFVPDENDVFAPTEKLEKAAQHTHYYPTEWKGREGLPQTYAAFTALFTYKLTVFAKELLSVLLTPYMLWCVLPRQAGAIAAFFARTTRRCDVVGDVCQYALFDGTGEPAPHSKMELSMIHFQDQYPGWKPTTKWQRELLHNRVEFLHQSLHTTS